MSLGDENVGFYGYFAKSDTNQEILDRGRYVSKADATITFAKRKQLDVESFNQIYEVIWLVNYL